MAKTVKRKKVAADAKGSRTTSKRKSSTTKRVAQSSAETPAPVAEASRSAHRWTFLTNHAHVLIVLDAEPSLVLRQVAIRVGITERAVQRIIHDLEESGIILRKRIGRQNHYEVLPEKPLRHPIEAHRKIGDLLALF